MCLEGCYHVVLAPSGDGREEDTDRSIARGANGTVRYGTVQSVSQSVS